MGIVFVISGPAGVGKTTLCDRLIAEFSETVKRVVTVTTRKPRVGEENGRDYHFLGRQSLNMSVFMTIFTVLSRRRYYRKLKIRMAKIFFLTSM